MKEHFYMFLRLRDGTTRRGVYTPRDAREVAESLSKETHDDVLIYRMEGSIRVRYLYERSQI